MLTSHYFRLQDTQPLAVARHCIDIDRELVQQLRVTR
jgi:hypothetical protein